MAIEDFEINGRSQSVLALSFAEGGTFNMVRWNSATETWEPNGVETFPDRYVPNLPVSVTLTELIHFDGNFEKAYQGIDYLPFVFSATETAGLKWWQELIVQHSTDVDWINNHSGDLT